MKRQKLSPQKARNEQGYGGTTDVLGLSQALQFEQKCTLRFLTVQTDIMTKSLKQVVFLKLRRMLGVCYSKDMVQGRA